MRRDHISYLFPCVVLAALVCIIAGLEVYPQSQGSSMDGDFQIRENTRNAAMTMRKLSSAEMQYLAGSEAGEFATAMELFSRDLIDADLADALGCPQMRSAKGKLCPGNHNPLRGYLYRMEVLRSTDGGVAKFRATGIPAVAKGEAQTGWCSFHVDQTHIIRASDDPEVEAGPQSPALGTPQAPVIR